MWYGVLGTKELLHRTYRNLEQKVLLEVSGSLLAWWVTSQPWLEMSSTEPCLIVPEEPCLATGPAY